MGTICNETGIGAVDDLLGSRYFEEDSPGGPDEENSSNSPLGIPQFLFIDAVVFRFVEDVQRE